MPRARASRWSWLLLIALAVPRGPNACRAQDLGTLLDDLEIEAQPPGKKDQVQVLGPLLIGLALWDTSEERGGYFGAIGEIEDPLAGCPSESYALVDAQGDSTPVTAIQGTIHEYLFERSWAQFSYIGDSVGTLFPPHDFDDAFCPPPCGSGAPVTFVMTQNTVFSPYKSHCGPDAWAPYEFPGLTDELFSPAGAGTAAGIRLAQNIGFANHTSFMAGEFDFNVAYPLMTKHALQWSPPLSDPASHSIDPLHPRQPFQFLFPGIWQYLWDADLPPSGPPPAEYRNVAMSIVHPEVAALVRDSIRERVDPSQYGPGVPAYYAIGGEFVIGGPPNLNAEGWFATNQPPQVPPFTPSAYLNVLPNTDYSDHSLRFFRQWLARRYHGAPGISAATQLAQAWGWPQLAQCADIESCVQIDPVAAAGDGVTPLAGNLEALYGDWTAFQADQSVAALDDQYRAAKQALPGAPPPTGCSDPGPVAAPPPMVTLQFDIPGGERGAARSDGVAYGNWYLDNADRLALLTPMKLRAQHAVTTGEFLAFPIFGMPRDVTWPPGSTACMDPTLAHDPEAPYQFGPPCWDYEFSNRTLREFVALGVDSLGLAYWEAPTLWAVQPGNFDLPPGSAPPPPLGNVAPVFDPGNFTIKGGSFGGSDGNIVQAMNAEVAGLGTSRSFMTPWRSPLLVYVGTTALNAHQDASTKPYADGPTLAVIESLGRAQAQWAPLSDLGQLDDLWVGSKRELLLLPFVPDLDAGDVAVCLEGSKADGYRTIVMASYTKPNGKDLKPLIPPATIVAPGVALLSGPEPYATILPCQTRLAVGTVNWFLVVVHASKLATALATFDGGGMLADGLDKLVSRPIRPVVAVPSAAGCTADPDPASLSGIDMTVMTDGLNLMVSVANVSGAPQCFDLAFDQRLLGPRVTGYAVDGGPFVDVGQGDDDALGSVLAFARAVVSGLDGVTQSQLGNEIEVLRAQVAARCQAGFDASAALTIIAALDGIVGSDPGAKEKLLAGLVRLRRHLFLRFDAATSELRVARVDGSPVTTAMVQVELPLQSHVRRSGFVAGPTGSYPLDVTIDPTAEVWDPVKEQYVVPVAGVDPHIVEIQVQDVASGAQSVLVVDLSP